MSKAVTLWIPDLLSKQRIAGSEQAWLDLELPALRNLLKKADLFPTKSLLTQKSRGFFANASNLFHQPQTLPVAATMAKALLSEFDEALFWIKIDPIQMVPDRDTLVLLPAEDLGITEDEARALIKAFNEHFEQDQVAIIYGSPNDWFLSVKQAVDLKTTPLTEARYSHLDDKYPTGNAAQYWRQLLNEASMLFFTHNVNEQRREQGKPEINGVWLWGEGKLDRSTLEPREDAKIWSSNTYLQGLAALTNAEFAEYPQNQHPCLDAKQTHHLLMPSILIDRLDNLSFEEWIEAVKWLESEWLAPLLQSLKEGDIHSLLLELGDGYRYHIEPKHLKRFWRFKNRI